MKSIIKIGLSVLILLVSTLLFGIFLPNLVLRNNIINKTSTYAEKYQPCLQRLVSNKGQLVPKGVNIIPYTGIIIDSINEIDSKANQPFEVNFRYIGLFGIPSNSFGYVNCSENDYLF